MACKLVQILFLNFQNLLRLEFQFFLHIKVLILINLLLTIFKIMKNKGQKKNSKVSFLDDTIKYLKLLKID